MLTDHVRITVHGEHALLGVAVQTRARHLYRLVSELHARRPPRVVLVVPAVAGRLVPRRTVHLARRTPEVTGWTTDVDSRAIVVVVVVVGSRDSTASGGRFAAELHAAYGACRRSSVAGALPEHALDVHGRRASGTRSRRATADDRPNARRTATATAMRARITLSFFLILY